MSRTVYRRLLFATFTGDIAEVERIGAEAAEIPWQDSALLISAVFGLTMEKHFGESTEPEVVAAFVKDAADRFPGLDTEVALDVVRIALGEDVPVDRLNSMDSMQVQVALTHHVFAVRDAVADDIAELLDHAEAMLDMTAPQPLVPNESDLIRMQ